MEQFNEEQTNMTTIWFELNENISQFASWKIIINKHSNRLSLKQEKYVSERKALP